MKYGYARVSKKTQNYTRQIEALKNAGAEIIIKEKEGSTKEKPMLTKLLYDLKQGDTLIFTDIDRIGRSVKDLRNIMDLLRYKGIDVISLNQGRINIETPEGKMFFTLMSMSAEYERDMIIRRTKSALQARKLQGANLGRPKMSKEKEKEIIHLLNNPSYSINRISKILNISRPTIYKIIRNNPNKVSRKIASFD